ncbi:hypothetical protein JZO66_10820 [Enterococcus sp. DIV0242_7C1]|uniref:Uncharacterized protein n=1 Tax=Candidatus Enterococcus dunnyi TaxID=1834192 RepID=A0A200JD34_9ENTE|nr:MULTISPECIES: hypothetical protein [unclassified Enterococcus]MBO0471037.1 hypothetical protein [Enterococcus sp. DIV0242_7C1]OUZ34771.1 hypothetical protein A5889_000246 [Enterococcus sp. 9D6_DIV0238]
MKHSAICIKAVPYQEIIDLRNTLERLDSWQEPLAVLEKYFTNPGAPINKKKVVKEYYACSKIFQTFNLEFNRLIQEAELQILAIGTQEKTKYHTLV